MRTPAFGSPSLRWIALLVPITLLAGCASFGQSEEATAPSCAAPAEGDGWRVVASEGEGGSPREIPLPSGSVDVSAQMILTAEETCVAGAFGSLPSGQVLTIALNGVSDGLVTFSLGGVAGDPSWTCHASADEKPQSGDLGGGIAYQVEPSGNGCQIRLAANDAAALEGASFGWHVQELPGGGSVRFSASRA